MNKLIKKTGLAAAMLLLGAGSIFAQVSDQDGVKSQTKPVLESKTIDVNTGQELDKEMIKQRTEESVARRAQIQEDIRKIKTVTPEAYGQMTTEEKAAIDADPMHFVTDQDKRQVIGEYVRKTYFNDKEAAKED